MGRGEGALEVRNHGEGGRDTRGQESWVSDMWGGGGGGGQEPWGGGKGH